LYGVEIGRTKTSGTPRNTPEAAKVTPVDFIDKLILLDK